jgi:adenylate kinase
MNLIMLGPPGAGKGTQAERFARAHGIPKISTGDILREAVSAGTDLGRVAKETMDAGRLVSDEVMIGIVRERLARPDAVRGFVLDGFPRTVAQAEALDRMMEGRGPLLVVKIVVPPKELARRVGHRRVCGKCGFTAAGDDQTECERCAGPLVQRSDDEEVVVRKRLQVYERDTKPLVEYYRARPTFRAVDGNRPPAEVAEALEAAVASMAGRPTPKNDHAPNRQRV